MASGGSPAAAVPEVALRFGNARPMPAVAIGTAASTPVTHEATKNAVLAAIEVGFRNLDTASMYGSERPVGEAVAEAVRRRVVASRAEVFVTTKVWCSNLAVSFSSSFLRYCSTTPCQNLAP